MCLTLQDHGWSCDHRYEDCRCICCRYQGTDRQMHVLGIWMNTSFVANVFYKRSLLMGVSCLVLGSQISRFKLTFINGFAFTKFSKISLNAFFYYLLLLFAIHYIIIIIIIIIITVFRGQHFICHWSALQNNLGLRTWNYVELSYIEWLILVGRVGSLERVRESVILLINSLTIVNPRNASMICFIFISFIF